MLIHSVLFLNVPIIRKSRLICNPFGDVWNEGRTLMSHKLDSTRRRLLGSQSRCVSMLAYSIRNNTIEGKPLTHNSDSTKQTSLGSWSHCVRRWLLILLLLGKYYHAIFACPTISLIILVITVEFKPI